MSSLLAVVVLLSQAQPNVTWIFPRPELTPGDVLTTDAKKVCRPGYASHIRNVPESIKARVMAKYDVPWADRETVEIDHLIPLELGGSNSVANLWPQRYDIPVGAHQKDELETYLHREVCARRLDLKDAQKKIRSNWYFEWRRCCAPKDEQDQPVTDPTRPLIAP